jgi:hypothetical protein
VLQRRGANGCLSCVHELRQRLQRQAASDLRVSTLMTRYDAYVLRFWRSTGMEGPQWKGKLEHLGQGESAQFDDLEALLRYIRAIAGVERERDNMTSNQPEGTGI